MMGGSNRAEIAGSGPCARGRLATVDGVNEMVDRVNGLWLRGF